MPTKHLSFASHKAKWQHCELCELCNVRKNVVLLRGTIPAKVLFVGEAPGVSEDTIGRPFIGPAGKLLDQIIAAAGLVKGDYAITNVIACIPMEDSGNKIGKWISPGYAAAAMYLMGTSGSDPNTYYEADKPCEDLLNLDNWDTASKFFVELAGGADSLKAVREAITKLAEQGNTGVAERWAILVKAFNQYVEGKPITAKTVGLKTEMKDEVRVLVEDPLLGGIDIGEEGLHFAATKEQAANGEEADPTPEQIAERAHKVRNKGKGKQVAKRKGKIWAAGDHAWCHDYSEPGEVVFVVVKEDPYECDSGDVEVLIECEDKGEEAIVNVDQLDLEQHRTK